MNRDNYIGGSISTRIHENNLLTRNDLERLNDYDSVDEVLSALNDSSYRESIQELNRPEEYEKILDDELKKFLWTYRTDCRRWKTFTIF